jgi:hypothetical protein
VAVLVVLIDTCLLLSWCVEHISVVIGDTAAQVWSVCGLEEEQGWVAVTTLMVVVMVPHVCLVLPLCVLLQQLLLGVSDVKG